MANEGAIAIGKMEDFTTDQISGRMGCILIRIDFGYYVRRGTNLELSAAHRDATRSSLSEPLWTSLHTEPGRVRYWRGGSTEDGFLGVWKPRDHFIDLDISELRKGTHPDVEWIPNEGKYRIKSGASGTATPESLVDRIRTSSPGGTSSGSGSDEANTGRDGRGGRGGRGGPRGRGGGPGPGRGGPGRGGRGRGPGSGGEGGSGSPPPGIKKGGNPGGGGRGKVLP